MRTELMTTFTDVGEYLNSLQMVSEKGNWNPFQQPRMAQLINKSNQFHLTGTRYSETELQAVANHPSWDVRYFKLLDKFGDNGLISVVVLNSTSNSDLIIDTWVMSCRVLGRTMEAFICNDIIEIGRSRGSTAIVGKYIPSAKNKMVSPLYSQLGFSFVSDDNGTTTWRLELSSQIKRLDTWVIPLI
jgi:FkbH-like protein